MKYEDLFEENELIFNAKIYKTFKCDNCENLITYRCADKDDNLCEYYTKIYLLCDCGDYNEIEIGVN